MYSLVRRYQDYFATDSFSQDGFRKGEKAKRLQPDHPFGSHVRLSWSAEAQARTGLQGLCWQVDERESSTARLSFAGRLCAEQRARCERGDGANGAADLFRCGHQRHGTRSEAHRQAEETQFEKDDTPTTTPTISESSEVL